MQSVDNKLREVLAIAGSEEAAPAEAEEKAAVSATDSLAAALKGDAANNEAALAQMKKEHPLSSVLQFANGAYGCVVGYANYRDTAEVNKLLAHPPEHYHPLRHPVHSRPTH